ncbi:M99 family carboxypeptidase catalytic domain-containing protein [Campylobacter sp. MG1]|uniref:M99 family carboxypeptidase catalytic domain-containing protein n=1 Tax=Campylobacter sp. MG1 TaxID=2976332 RepID=UPI00226CAA49|nr:M99 family carboxypeptidase catalytic domain-containing protein [Campylobacter sp. MG1]
MLKIFLTFLSLNLFALNFTINTLGECEKVCDNTVLIFGGIQGDEPGGFHAASLLITDYKITKGKVIVVPNLAFDSIIARSRGEFGDLNRKFAELSEDDPDYYTVELIKKIITLPEVKLIINLHDGSGYYSPKYINKDKNPSKWGNSCIIDQDEINAKYGKLNEIASATCEVINQNLLNKIHTYNLKNTNTAKGDKEMLKSLTYYAITQGKAAYANEASKNLLTHERAYYHLLAIENYLKAAGVEFERDFELKPNEVKNAIEKAILVKLDNRFLLYLHNARPVINYIPIKLPFKYNASNELTAIFPNKDKKSFSIQYGNRFQTKLLLEKNVEYSDITDKLELIVDDKEINTKFAKIIKVKNYFLIKNKENVRINVIGYNTKGSEYNIKISLKNMQKQYSIDKAGKIYRVEAYEDKKFIGAILVKFI